MPEAAPLAAQLAELLDDTLFSAEQLAHACGVAPCWVHARVEAGVLQVDRVSGAWRFDSLALVRARRLVHLESAYDADPQLAALTVDLIEEVTRLRRRSERSGA